MASLRIGEVALRLSCTPETVRTYVRRGFLRAERTPGNQMRFDVRDVDALRGGGLPDTPAPAPAPVSRQGKPLQPIGPAPRAGQRLTTARDDISRHGGAADELNAIEDDGWAEPDILTPANAERIRRAATEAERAAHQRRLGTASRLVFSETFVPFEFRGAIAAAIQAFATPAQLPAWLSDAEMADVIKTHARTILVELKAEVARREEERWAGVRERIQRAVDEARAPEQPTEADEKPGVPRVRPASIPMSLAEARRLWRDE